nr:hypothetical protein [Nitrosopumilus sp.]
MEEKKETKSEIITEIELPDHLVELLNPVEKPEPTTQVSILLGAGFSVPAGYPTAAQLNERLKTIDASEILIDGSGTAFFLNGQEDNNAMLSTAKRFFVRKFLELYSQKLESEGKQFNYEVFFDYYTNLRQKSVSDSSFDDFAKNFKQEYGESDHYQLIHEFDQTFQQLIAGILYKKVEQVHHIGGYPGYDLYLQLLRQLGENNIVHIHTLNHDLHMEQLRSPYYFSNDGMTVRTMMFDNKYATRHRLYKLHGSVDNLNYIFNEISFPIRCKNGCCWKISSKLCSIDGQCENRLYA